MPKLIIDNREVVVAPGTKIIEAAQQLDIMIPRFCYHPALGAVGACRVCAVKVLEGPARTTGIQMSCMLEAQDGMVVSTTDAEAADFRRHIIEFLMLNHPHDCPVCDEGGHCLLQDMTVSSGHGIRRYKGKKRTHRDQDLGPLLQHEMNRCIQCYRCVRFYREYAGYNDLGVMGIGSRVYYGRIESGTLESPFSGNLADICPTGVFTDKPSRYRGRRWDFERTPSVCIHCSLGCHTVVCSRYREVIRQEARFSPVVNGYFICDRGRQGFAYASSEDRPRTAVVGGRPSSVADAASEARSRIARLQHAHGPGAVACVGSLRSSLESQRAWKSACKARGWQGPAFFQDDREGAAVLGAAAGIDRSYSISMAEMEQADLVVLLGADPVNEAPMAALAMRQAARAGAPVFVLDPRPVSLPMPFSHIPMAAHEIGPAFEAVLGISEDAPADTAPGIDNLRQAMDNSRRPVIVCGTDVVPATLPAAAAAGAAQLKSSGKAPGLFYLLPGPNAMGAALFAEKSPTIAQVVADIESGSIRGLVLVENGLFHRYPDRQRLEKALAMLELLVVVDCLNPEGDRRPDIFLPAATVFESGGIFINQEGRAQEIAPSFKGGTPLSQITGGDHPPREFSTGIPGTEPEPSWSLAALLTGDADETPALLAEQVSALSTLDGCRPFPEGGVLLDKTLGLVPAVPLPAEDASPADEDQLALVFTEWTFGTEELSVHSPSLDALGRKPYAVMHEADAAEMGLSDGDTLSIEGDAGRLQIRLETAAVMARGVLVIPRHHRIRWQIFGGEARAIDRRRIQKT